MMETKDAIRYVLHSARYVTDRYLSDLSDEDLVVRPAPQAHHIAWQLGHLLLSEAMMVSAIKAGSSIVFPSGFEKRHSPEAGSEYQDDGEPFCTKDLYQSLREEQRRKTLELVESLPDEELSLPGPIKMQSYAPTNGAVLLAIGTHEMMHSGQLAVVRRFLGKSVVI